MKLRILIVLVAMLALMALTVSGALAQGSETGCEKSDLKAKANFKASVKQPHCK